MVLFQWSLLYLCLLPQGLICCYSIQCIVSRISIYVFFYIALVSTEQIPSFPS